MNSAMMAIAPQIGIAAACRGLGVARATFYRAQRPVSARQSRAPRPASHRAPAEQLIYTSVEGDATQSPDPVQ